MSLLTSFHILFDIPKEDIGNSNQPERERGQKGYLSRQIVSKGKFDSLARKQASRLSFRVFRATFLPHYMYCMYCTYFILPTSLIRTRREEIVDKVYRSNLTNSPESRQQVSPVQSSLSLSLNLNPITKQILILTRLLSELKDSISPPSYHCDSGWDSGILQLDYMYLPDINDWVCPVGVREDMSNTT